MRGGERQRRRQSIRKMKEKGFVRMGGTQKGHRDMEGEKWKRGSGEKTYKARDWDIVRPTLGGGRHKSMAISQHSPQH